MYFKKLDNPLDVMLGLAFKSEFEPIYFQTRWGIHTFFVNKSIDVFICDDNFVIKKISRSLKPWRIFLWNPKFMNVFESPAGYFKSRKLVVGGKINPVFI